MTATSTSHIDPTEGQISAFAVSAAENEGPVVMINLLKFNDEGGRASYERYGHEVQPHLDRVGASVIYAGDASNVLIGQEVDRWWDTILAVRYPSRAAFLDMVSSPDYQAIAVHRTAALTTSALIATDPWPVDLA